MQVFEVVHHFFSDYAPSLHESVADDYMRGEFCTGSEAEARARKSVYTCLAVVMLKIVERRSGLHFPEEVGGAVEEVGAEEGEQRVRPT